jgi:carbon-monoxide dehydrogenase large subunit
MVFQSIGRDVQRVDGLEKVTGSAVYAGDLRFPGMLVVEVLRSPFASAHITTLDTEKALKVSGVVAVLTGRDVPGPFGVAIKDQYPLAQGQVRYAGEPVAAVIALTRRAAHQGVQSIEVAWEPRPFCVSPRKAAAPDAPLLYEDLAAMEMAPYVVRETGNVYQHFKVRRGRVDEAFARCDVIVEGDFAFPYVQHAMMEPHCAIACYRPDNSFEIHASTQSPFVVQECVSELFEVPYHKIRVSAPYLGGGFGGKSDVTIEALAACCARAVPGRYVKLQLRREEMFGGVTLSRGVETSYRLGFSSEGRLLAMRGVGYQGSGANADYAVNIVGGMALAGAGPYEVENLELDMYGVYTNTPPNGALRGYGHPEVHMAIESLMDQAARRLGLAPHELRLKNLLAPGKVNGIGQRFDEHSGDVVQCTEKVAASLYAHPPETTGQGVCVGRGIASFMKTPCMPANCQSGARIKPNADGTLSLLVGAVEMGQGTNTVLAQICAEALGLPVEKVSVLKNVDTLVSPYEWQTVASHSTWGSGNAILAAAEELKAKLRQAAAARFEVEPSEVVLKDGCAWAGDASVSWGELSVGLRNADGSALTEPLEATGFFVPDGIQNPDPDGGQSNAAADWTVGCVGAEVSVDRMTGVVSVQRLVTCLDAGTIVNPLSAQEQVKSGMVLSVGSALTERLCFSEERGHIRNGSLTDYKIPGIEDLPASMEVMFVQTPEKSGPYGAKGLGEHGTVGVVPAILNAIEDATGLRFNALPISADEMLASLKEVR